MAREIFDRYLAPEDETRYNQGLSIFDDKYQEMKKAAAAKASGLIIQTFFSPHISTFSEIVYVSPCILEQMKLAHLSPQFIRQRCPRQHHLHRYHHPCHQRLVVCLPLRRPHHLA